jgi:hypothetical protein
MTILRQPIVFVMLVYMLSGLGCAESKPTPPANPVPLPVDAKLTPHRAGETTEQVKRP